MLKRLYKLFSNSDKISPLVLPDSDHDLSHLDVSKNACIVIEQLKKSGFMAYLVGGGVRDLLLGDEPKDFDVATDATPEQIKKVFKNARIIGRRFRIVHVRFGREIIEVTTFRGRPNNHKDSNHEHSRRSEKGMLLRDNVYGDIKSDALRRDFTVNALYYAPDDGAILDYTNGLADLDARQLRLIGNPEERYKEDPVRMLRAVRFSAKLGFNLTPETEAPIHHHADYLQDIPPARRFEEVLKLFISGYATATLSKLREYGLLQYLFPSAEACFDDGGYCEKLVYGMVSNTDKRLRNNKRVTPAFVYAVMLWPQIRKQTEEMIEKHQFSLFDAHNLSVQGAIEQQLSYTAIPKRFLIPMREIWSLQLRLPKREGRRAYQLLEHPRFRAAYDFLLLREEAGEQLDGLGLWWTRFQDASAEEQATLVAEINENSKKRRSRRRNQNRQGKPNAYPRRT